MDELAVICTLLKSKNPAVFFEIGTFDGRTTLNARRNLPESAKIYTLDLPPEEDLHKPDNKIAGQLIKEEVAKGTVTQLYGNTLNFDFSPYHNTADFIFIDACHAYKFVKNDTLKAIKMLKPKGVMVWHDYAQIGDVTQFVNEFMADNPQLGDFFKIKDTSLACLFMK